MESYLFDWLNLLLRWLHVITAIAWIGASFYFIWLDNSLESPPQWKKDKGVSGDLWAFHGGGIYEVAKYQLAPAKMPYTLHWFKWEAYSTWITGALLLFVIYYLQADLYLRGDNSWLDTPAKLILASVLFIASGFLIYEVLVRSRIRNHLLSSVICIFLLISVSCWLATYLFSGRAAFLHVGAMMATIMAANVFVGIMPAQRSFIKAVESGHQPDRHAMQFAKLRSVHNNYFTLPVLFCMISNHYAFLYSHTYNWIVLITIIVVSAYARHFFNLRHKKILKPQILLVSIAIFIALFFILSYSSTTRQKKVVEFDQARYLRLEALINTHCTVCHAAQPTQPGFSAAPGGLLLETASQISHAREKIIVAVESEYMPLGNVTSMSASERDELLKVLTGE